MDPRGRFVYPPAPPPDRRGSRTPFPGGSFSDRVMARVAREPGPTPARAFVRSVGHLALRDAAAALSTAWRLVFRPSGAVSAPTRARAAALVISVILVVGVGAPLLTSGGLAFLAANGPTSQQLDAGAPAVTPAADLEARPVPKPSPSVKKQQPDATETRSTRKPPAVKADDSKPEPDHERERDEHDDD